VGANNLPKVVTWQRRGRFVSCVQIPQLSSGPTSTTMSDVEWDDEGFEPPSATVTAKDRWAGEDEDDVKDNWDDENEEEDENKPTDNGVVSTAAAKKKKSLKERIAEKEEKKRIEQEQKRKEQEEDADDQQLSAEEMAAEKARQRQLQEESDLLLAVETFGVSDGLRGQIDGMEPSSKEDFDKFEELLRAKITKYEKSPHYVPFLESLFRQISIDLEADDIKRLGSTLTALSNEKAKQQKSTKGKKKKQKASLVVGKDTDDVLAETGGYDEYEDFI